MNSINKCIKLIQSIQQRIYLQYDTMENNIEGKILLLITTHKYIFCIL